MVRMCTVRRFQASTISGIHPLKASTFLHWRILKSPQNVESMYKKMDTKVATESGTHLLKASTSHPSEERNVAMKSEIHVYSQRIFSTYAICTQYPESHHIPLSEHPEGPYEKWNLYMLSEDPDVPTKSGTHILSEDPNVLRCSGTHVPPSEDPEVPTKF